MMKTVEWLAPERVLPALGVVKTGGRASLPAEIADKYIAQGEARLFVELARSKKIIDEET